jgi:hypothetical protein
MIKDFYSKQTYDFKAHRGDTLSIPLSFYNSAKTAVDITGFGATFDILDPQTDAPIAALEKTHDDGVAGGDGIYFFGDSEAWTELGLTAVNQVQIVLKASDTEDLDPQVYKWELEFTKTINGVMCRQTVAAGYLTVVKDVVPNV